jgi:hypothetical protein
MNIIPDKITVTLCKEEDSDPNKKALIGVHYDYVNSPSAPITIQTNTKYISITYDQIEWLREVLYDLRQLVKERHEPKIKLK